MIETYTPPDLAELYQTRYLSAIMTPRGAANLGCLAILFMLMVALLYVAHRSLLIAHCSYSVLYACTRNVLAEPL
jgi:hypothetical protein